MVPGDNRRTARTAARMFPDRVIQYYDPGKAVGRSYSRDVFADCLREALAVVDHDDPMADHLRDWAADPASRPVWDAVLFYPAAANWEDRPPLPTHWIKQVGFYGAEARPGPTGRFWVNSCTDGARESDWHDEVRAAMQEMLYASQRADFSAGSVTP